MRIIKQVRKFLNLKDVSDNTYAGKAGFSPVVNITEDGLELKAQGGGDMYKAAYDITDNSIVDKAEALDDGAGNTASAAGVVAHFDDNTIHFKIEDTTASGTTVFSSSEVETRNALLQINIDGKEDDLGNPTNNGDVLSSLTDGTRSWIAPGAGGDMTKAVYDTLDNGVVDDSEKLGGSLPSVYDQSAHVADTTTNPHHVSAAQTGAEPANANIQAHIANTTTNPHHVNKGNVGLGLADNTADLDKPISNATQTALNLKADAQDLTNHINDGDLHLSADERAALTNSPNPPTGVNTIATQADIAASGGGDMLKSVYDLTDNSIVDKAEALDDGAGNTKTAAEVVSHIDDTSIHFVIDDTTPSAASVYSSSEIDTQTAALQSNIDHKEDWLDNPATNGELLSSTAAGVRSWVAPSTADMTKAVYDTNDNGIVDDAEKLNSQLPDYYLSYGANQDTEANILGLNPTTYLGQVWWATDTRERYEAVTSNTEGINVWQRIGVDYNTTTDTYSFPTTQDGQTQNAGQEVFFPAHTDEIGAITALEPKVFLVTGVNPTIDDIKEAVLPVASDIAEGAILGLNTSDKNSNGYIKVAVYGDLNDVKTDQWAEKAILYVDPVIPGGLTDIKPPSKAYSVAQVLISNVSTGKIKVNTIRDIVDRALTIPAGLDRIHLTADKTDAGDPVGLDNFYLAKREDRGIIVSDTQTVVCTDDSTTGVILRHLGPQLTLDSNLNAGTYHSYIEYQVDNSDANEKVRIEIYLANADGTVVDSGSGLPSGNLGVPPIVAGSTGLLNTAAATTSFAEITMSLTSSLDGLAGQRVLFYLLGEKVGTAGETKTFTFYYGTSHTTFVEVPQLISFSDLSDVDTQEAINGDVAMFSINNIWENTAPTALITGRMRWRGDWAGGTYVTDDVVIDGEWTMVANIETIERPAPQPIGAELYLYQGTITPITVSAKQIIIGARATSISNSGYLNGYRVYTHIGSFYETYWVENPLGTPIFHSIDTFTGTIDGWFEVALPQSILNAGATFDIIARITEADPAPAEVLANYNYSNPNNTSIPVVGEISHSTKSLDSLRVHVTDSDGTDRTSVLAAMTIGDTIFGAGTEWTIQVITDNTTWFDFTVSPALQGSPTGVQSFAFRTVVAQDIDTGQDIDYWLTHPTVKGLIAIDDDYADITVTNDAYGIDMLLQDILISDDWDVVAFSGGVASGGGGDSGVTIHQELTGREVSDQHPIDAITGLQTAIDSKENVLGNPSITGQLLSSTNAGARSWVDPPAPIEDTGFSVTQISHGFSLGNPIAEDGGLYVLAENTSINTAAEGVVIEVIDADNLRATTVGELSWVGHGYPVNKWLYLGTAGGYTTTAPATDGKIVQYCFKALDAARIYIDISSAELLSTPPVAADMFKSAYDNSGVDGIVDNAELVNGLTVETAVPVGALFTDTTDHTAFSNIGTLTHDQLDAHAVSTANPHTVTQVQVGLGNVDNTTDLDKPISTATQTALDGKVDDSQVLTDVPAGAVFTDTPYDDALVIKSTNALGTDNAIVRVDGTGRLIQNSLASISDAGEITGSIINSDNNTITNIGIPEFDNDTTAQMGNLSGLAFDKLSLTVVEEGGLLYLDVENILGGDARFYINGNISTLDCTTGNGIGGVARIQLTAGTDANTPKTNWIYATDNLGTASLVISIGTVLPTGPFAWIGKVVVPDTATWTITSAYAFQRFTEAFINDSRGTQSHAREKLRVLGATYATGVAHSLAITVNPATPDNVHLQTASGTIYQLHRQNFPPFTTGPYYYGNGLNVYEQFDDLNKALQLQDGTPITNKERYILVIWGAVNIDDGTCKLFVNQSEAVYGNDAQALSDVNNTADYTVPDGMRTVAFMIAKIVMEYTTGDGGTWSELGTSSLLGTPIGIRVGGSSSTLLSNEFSDAQFRIFGDLDDTRRIAFQVDQLTIGTTRTLTAQDKDITIAGLSDIITDHTNLTSIGNNTHAQIDAHIANTTTNPHHVDAAAVGLGNVDNTGDLDKPISSDTQAALNLKEGSLGNPLSNGDMLVSTIAGVRSWLTPVTLHSQLSLNDGTNPHSTTQSDVGLSNVDNTSDLNKPISTATQTALDLKEDWLNNPASDGRMLVSTTAGVRSWVIAATPVTNHSQLTLDDGTNPHGTTKGDVGLINVDNTSDLAKPISTATQTALDGKIDDAQVLTNVPAGALFTDTTDHTALSNIGTNTHASIDTHIGTSNIHFTIASISHLNIADIGTNSHALIDTHIGNTTTNPHHIDAASIGLENVDNTSDADKPISTATQTALDLKTDNTAFNAHTGSAILHMTADQNDAFDGANAPSSSNVLATIDDLTSLGGGDMLRSVYDTDLSGVVDDSELVNGLTVETAVPLNAVFTDTLSTGLEQLNEGNGIGVRLIDRIAGNYGNIGLNATDLSISSGASTVLGATGTASFAANSVTTASGDNSTAFGVSTIASGAGTTAFGSSSAATGNYSFAHGIGTISQNESSFVVGKYNIGTSPDTIFEVGAGTGTSARVNIVEIYTDGTLTSPETTITEINNRGVKALTTKEYVDALASTGLEAIDEGSGIGWRLVGRNPANYGNIGSNAVDFTFNSIANGFRGATGEFSFAAGESNIASGKNSVALGDSSQANGETSFAVGYAAVAGGFSGMAFQAGQASGSTSAAFGSGEAAGNTSFAVGVSSDAIGSASLAAGRHSIAKNDGSLAAGKYNIGTALDTIVEVGIGTGTTARLNAFEIYTDGTLTSPEATPALIDSRGAKALITKEYGDANYTATGVAATGLEYISEDGDLTFGWALIDRVAANYGPIGDDAVDTSYSDTTSSTRGATGDISHAEGANTTASGWMSHAEGTGTTASGISSHAEGSGSTASESEAHAEGNNTTASGAGSHAEGVETSATQIGSHAEGGNTNSQGSYSHAEGYYTVAKQDYQHVAGKFNVGTATDTIHETGIGADDTHRLNAFEIYTDGTATLPDATIAEINARGNTAIVTKEYADSVGGATNPNGYFEVKTSNFTVPSTGGNYEIRASLQMSFASDSDAGNYTDFLYSLGTLTFDWDNPPPNPMPILTFGHTYRVVRSGGGWSMIDLNTWNSSSHSTFAMDKIAILTQAQYDALTPSDDTVYITI